MAKHGIALPPSSGLQARQGKKVSNSRIKKGDLVFFEHRGKINHVGIVKEASRNELYVIHATSSSGVRIDEVKHNPYWSKRLRFSTSVIE
jgi:cell wall-associated NlpC family hydrolase